MATYYWKFPTSASSSTCGSKQNCEAIALFKGVLYGVQKTDAAEAQVYRIGAPGSLSTTEGGATEGTLVGTIGTHCPSAFSISADGTTVLTIQHNEVEVWRGKGDTIESLLTGRNIRVYRDEPGGNGEGADWWPYQSADFLVVSEDRQTFDYDVSSGTVLTSGIPSSFVMGSPTVTMAGVQTIRGVGAIASAADWISPEEEPGLDFGLATVTFDSPGEPAGPGFDGYYSFTPPVVLANPAILPATRGVARALFRHYGPYPVGQSVIWDGDAYVTRPTPDQLALVALDDQARLAGHTDGDGVLYFLGGHEYVVTAEVAEGLDTAGYGSNLTLIGVLLQ